MPRPAVPSRRSDILAAARQAFSARGFAATRMDDIARRAGISKAALYLQFDSKEALFEATTVELIEAMLPQAAPADFGDVPAEVLLRGLIAAFAVRLGESEMAFVPRVIIGEGMNFPDLARFYYENAVSRGMAVIDRIIRHGIARGEFVCADPAHACRSVIGGILVTAMWKHVFEPVGAAPIAIPAMAQTHADTLIEGLRRRKEAK
jgi:AcrR family transcriptional regulator